MKKILISLVLGLMASVAHADSYVIDTPRQIKPGVIQGITDTLYNPKFVAIGASTASLRTGLTAETTARIAADGVLVGQFAPINSQLTQVALDTTTLGGQISGMVSQLVAGTNITLTPPTGVGVVTIDATGGGGDAYLANSQTFTGANRFAGLTYFGDLGAGGQAYAVNGSGDATVLVTGDDNQVRILDDVGNWRAYMSGDGQGRMGLGGSFGNEKILLRVTDTNSYFKFLDGNEGAGKVMTSDAGGFASWQPAGAGGGDVYLAQKNVFTENNTFNSSVTLNNQMLIGGAYPQIVVDDVPGVATNGNFALWSLSNDGSFLVNNAYFDGNWKASKTGGSGFISLNNKTSDVGGDMSVYVASSTLANTLMPVTELMIFRAAGNAIAHPDAYVKMGGDIDMSSNTIIGVGRELISTSCGPTETTCVATCSADRIVTGGSCSADVVPLNSEIGDSSYTCNTGTGGNIVAKAVCYRIKN